ncbi:hypothetical protein [Fictibacillus sp. NRS-1165]|uniref:hypothetical protein n=1 Tax=Fictibacillus sp. NRS-1165 TaxID=3144463 RepID=UPI003D1E0F3E
MALKKGTVLYNEGPKESSNGSQIFRLMREGNKENLDIAIGQQLTVGEEITAEEGQYLLNSSTWAFKEVGK